MELLNKIKKDILVAAKSGDKVVANYLKVVVGEVERDSSRDFSDSKVQAILQKLNKDTTEAYNKFKDESLKVELKILSNYLPKTVTGQALVDKVKEAAKSVGGSLEAKVIFPAIKQLSKAESFIYNGKEAKDIVDKLKSE